MQVNIVAHHSASNRGVILMLFLQRIKLIEDILSRYCFLVDPALLTLGGLNSQKAAAALQHFELIAVLHGPGPVRNCRHAITQKCLLGGDIDILRGRLRPQP